MSLQNICSLTATTLKPFEEPLEFQTSFLFEPNDSLDVKMEAIIFFSTSAMTPDLKQLALWILWKIWKHKLFNFSAIKHPMDSLNLAKQDAKEWQNIESYINNLSNSNSFDPIYNKVAQHWTVPEKDKNSNAIMMVHLSVEPSSSRWIIRNENGIYLGGGSSTRNQNK